MIDFVDKIIPGNGSFDHPDYTGYFETLLCNTINLITLKYCAIQKKLYKYTYDFKWLLNILSLKCFEINLKINFIFNLNLNLYIFYSVLFSKRIFFQRTLFTTNTQFN